MEDVICPVDGIVLQSPNAKFRVALRLGDDGGLCATLLQRLDDGKYEPPQGVVPAKLTRISRGPGGEIASYFGS